MSGLETQKKYSAFCAIKLNKYNFFPLHTFCWITSPLQNCIVTCDKKLTFSSLILHSFCISGELFELLIRFIRAGFLFWFFIGVYFSAYRLWHDQQATQAHVALALLVGLYFCVWYHGWTASFSSYKPGDRDREVRITTGARNSRTPYAAQQVRTSTSTFITSERHDFVKTYLKCTRRQFCL